MKCMVRWRIKAFSEQASQFSASGCLALNLRGKPTAQGRASRAEAAFQERANAEGACLKIADRRGDVQPLHVGHRESAKRDTCSAHSNTVIGRSACLLADAGSLSVASTMTRGSALTSRVIETRCGVLIDHPTIACSRRPQAGKAEARRWASASSICKRPGLARQHDLITRLSPPSACYPPTSRCARVLQTLGAYAMP